MQGTQKQIEWAESIKADMMPGIATIRESFIRRANGNEKVLEVIDRIMEALEAKDAPWWIDRRPQQDGKLNAGAHMDAWKVVAAEIIKA